MTANGPCAVCKAIAGFYSYAEPKGWYCWDHIPDQVDINQQLKEREIREPHDRRSRRALERKLLKRKRLF